MEDQDVIREQMENTRSALSEKLEALEDRVTTTVKGASQEVTQTVETVTDSVQETVETVKDTVEETLSAVKDGVNVVKSFFDVPLQVDRYPWIAVGGSLALGYFLGEYLLTKKNEGSSARNRRYPATQVSNRVTSSSNGEATTGHNGTAAAVTEESLVDRLAPELAKLKGLALGALMGTVREMVVNAAGENLAKPMGEIIDSVTVKIGGTPVPARTHD